MLESVSLEWIRSFVAFAECEGVEEAAQKIGLTQPAISQHLAKLESALNLELFERDGKRKILSVKGNDLYQKLALNMRDMDESLRASKFSKSKENEITIRLGLNRDIFYRICDKIEFAGTLEFFNQRSTTAIRALLKREVDVAIGRVTPDSPEIISVKWYSDSFNIAYPRSWHKRVNRSNPIADLLERDFIFNLESKTQIEEVFAGLNVEMRSLRTKRRLTDWLSILKLVESGHGWAIVPFSFKSSDEIVFADIPVEGLSRTQFYILYHRSIRNFEGVGKLIASIKSSML